jgi:uncharacterized protein with HEPN domain
LTPRDRASLERILLCIAAVDAYVARTGIGWPIDDMTVDAVAKRVEEIGEIAKRVSPATLATMPEVDWRGVRGIREVSRTTTRTSMSRSSPLWSAMIFQGCRPRSS